MLEKLPPSVAALMLQCAAFFVTRLIVEITGLNLSLLQLAWLCGLIAALLSYVSGLAIWWLLIQLLFAPALILVMAIKLPPGLFLGAFLLLLFVYWSTYRTQVPLYLSSKKVWRELEKLLPAKISDSGFQFMDLGSGLGGVLTYLAKVRPDGNFIGVEAAPLPFVWSWLRIRLGRLRNSHVQWGSLWECDLSRYDVVFAYLSPVPMEKLWSKACAEMRPGTMFISSTFTVPDQIPQQTVQLDDLHNTTLLIWKM